MISPLVTNMGVYHRNNFAAYMKPIVEASIFYHVDRVYIFDNKEKVVHIYFEGTIRMVPYPGKFLNVVDCWRHEVIMKEVRNVKLYSLENGRFEICEGFEGTCSIPMKADMRHLVVSNGCTLPMFKELGVPDVPIIDSEEPAFIRYTEDGFELHVNGRKKATFVSDIRIQLDMTNMTYSNDKLISYSATMRIPIMYQVYGDTFVRGNISKRPIGNNKMLFLHDELVVFDSDNIKRISFVKKPITSKTLWKIAGGSRDFSSRPEVFPAPLRSLFQRIIDDLPTIDASCVPEAIPREEERVSFKKLATFDAGADMTPFLFKDFAAVFDEKELEDGSYLDITNIVDDNGVRKIVIPMRPQDNTFHGTLREYGFNAMQLDNKIYRVAGGITIYDPLRQFEMSSSILGKSVKPPIFYPLDGGLFAIVESIPQIDRTARLIIAKMYGNNIAPIEMVVVEGFFTASKTFYHGKKALIVSSGGYYMLLSDRIYRVLNAERDIIGLGPMGQITRRNGGIHYCGTLLENGFVTRLSPELVTVDIVGGPKKTYQLFSDGGVEEIPFSIVDINDNFALLQEGDKMTIARILRPDRTYLDIGRAWENVDQNNEVIQQLFNVLDDYTFLHRNVNQEFRIVGGDVPTIVEGDEGVTEVTAFEDRANLVHGVEDVD
jgi:hypothetical protein